MRERETALSESRLGRFVMKVKSFVSRPHRSKLTEVRLSEELIEAHPEPEMQEAILRAFTEGKTIMVTELEDGSFETVEDPFGK